MSGSDTSLPAGDPFAGFWRRAGARLIDMILIWVGYIIIALFIWQDLAVEVVVKIPDSGEATNWHIPSPLGMLVVGIAAWAYIAVMESSRLQATLGKRALGIKVCDYNGNRIGLFNASTRSWPLWLPWMINTVAILDLIVGMASLGACLAVAFNGRKQGLHDIFARCLVVKRQAVFSDAPGRSS
ncbi:MAG TPA: RDD family protein [Alphaproteobacteria bacterium]|jgi:uncharacterized RDD family membrane protein YckC|nr:RDD family protein [Alphaproteobacteria bacterium]